jgi:hypothetical protein
MSGEDLDGFLQDALARGENDQVEFKIRATAEALSRNIAAFANSNGGAIIVGVDDSGRVVGTDPSQVDAAVARAFSSLDPRPEVTVLRAERGGLQLAVVRVAQTSRGPVLWEGRALGRVGASDSPLSQDRIVRLAESAVRQGASGTPGAEVALAKEIGRLAAAISRLTEDGERLASSSPSGDTPQSGALGRVQRILTRFHIVATTLSRRQRNRPPFTISDEYDVQDLLHAALRMDFDDVRPEEWTPSFAGASSRMDFLLKRESVVVECKVTAPHRSDREIADELLVDIGRYQSHPDCKALVCFVYDPGGHLRNPTGLADDFHRRSTGVFRVVVVVTPRP